MTSCTIIAHKKQEVEGLYYRNADFGKVKSVSFMVSEIAGQGLPGLRNFTGPPGKVSIFTTEVAEDAEILTADCASVFFHYPPAVVIIPRRTVERGIIGQAAVFDYFFLSVNRRNHRLIFLSCKSCLKVFSTTDFTGCTDLRMAARCPENTKKIMSLLSFFVANPILSLSPQCSLCSLCSLWQILSSIFKEH
jgi:hypothetical protein